MSGQQPMSLLVVVFVLASVFILMITGVVIL